MLQKPGTYHICQTFGIGAAHMISRMDIRLVGSGWIAKCNIMGLAQTLGDIRGEWTFYTPEKRRVVSPALASFGAVRAPLMAAWCTIPCNVRLL